MCLGPSPPNQTVSMDMDPPRLSFGPGLARVLTLRLIKEPLNCVMHEYVDEFTD